MPLFDRIESGLPELDTALDHIRLGDNVVWQVSEIADYRRFVEPFVRQAIADKRNVIYIRFARHQPLIAPLKGLKIREFDPEEGFEFFTVAINELISEEGVGAFYVFDCLSELQAAWWADLMMGNFFRLTCPHLFELETVAYFPVLRGRHSFDTIARIRDTTQLLIDVYVDENAEYIYPLKVWHRYSATMFLPHGWNSELNLFEPLRDGVSAGRFYQVLNAESAKFHDQNLDSWERWFSEVKQLYREGHFSEQTRQDLCRSMITRDDKMSALIEKNFLPEDYFQVRSRMVGTGTIGGKTCGMLLARKIVEKGVPEATAYLEPHDSFFIGSDVFYTYIVHNNCWKLRITQKTADGWFTVAEDLQHRLLSGEFPDNIRDQFRRVLEYYGQCPIIVRSSSLLEDGFGNAFAGKYESVFCTGVGTFSERLLVFENAVRKVYASTMDKSALEYRKRRGLAAKDEQMAILVQRVSGMNFGEFYMPSAAGVGYSYSAWRPFENMDPAAGMLRMVVGLGTRAVDRIANDYPRLVNLERPTANVSSTVADKHRFSQSRVDILDFQQRHLRDATLFELLPSLPLWYRNQVLEHDIEAEDSLRNRGITQDVYFANCQAILENKDFTSFMQRMLQILQKHYENPVDIEFTVNTSAKNEFVVNLLQCRPLYVGKKQGEMIIPEFPKEKVFFDVRGSAMGDFVQEHFDVIISVSTKGYYHYPYARKKDVANAIGAINEYFKNTQKKLLLLVPGRIGTSSPELGVPVSFADISCYRALCEVSDKSVGYAPELSYGSHIFQDLVESEIFYAAITEDEKTKIYQPEMFEKLTDHFIDICPQFLELSQIVRVFDLGDRPLQLYLDTPKGHAVAIWE